MPEQRAQPVIHEHRMGVLYRKARKISTENVYYQKFFWQTAAETLLANAAIKGPETQRRRRESAKVPKLC